MDAQRQRFMEIMRRHVLARDVDLSDEAFVRTVFKRWELDRSAPLIDPNE